MKQCSRTKTFGAWLMMLTVAVIAGSGVADAGAISAAKPKIVFPYPNVRTINGSGNVFLGYGESIVKVEMVVLCIDGHVETVQATKGNTWAASYSWTSGNSQTKTARAVKGRLTYKDRSGVQKTYDSGWSYP